MKLDSIIKEGKQPLPHNIEYWDFERTHKHNITDVQNSNKTKFIALALSSIINSHNVSATQNQNVNHSEYCRIIENNHIQVIKYLSKAPKTDKEKINEKVTAFKSLKVNWDGYGAIPTEVKAAANTLSFLDRLDSSTISQIHDVYPNPHGTISIIWMNEAKERLSVEIGNDSFSYYCKRNGVETVRNNHVPCASVEEIKKINRLSKTI